jgi:hypothetical protein
MSAGLVPAITMLWASWATVVPWAPVRMPSPFSTPTNGGRPWP